MKTIAIMLLAAFSLCRPALAAEDSAKKTSDGVGNLFRGMGQEIKRGTDAAAPKKDDKKKEEKK